MSLLAPEDDAAITPTTSTTKKTSTSDDATANKSLLALALQTWTLCVLAVVLAALLVLAPAAVVIGFPVACMAASLCLLCAIAARLLLAPYLHLQPDRARVDERRDDGVRESRKQDCVEIDCAEAPGGLDEDSASSVEEEEPGERTEHVGRCEFSRFRDSCHGEQRPFFFVDTYYKSFYDLLAFWRRVERGQWS